MNAFDPTFVLSQSEPNGLPRPISNVRCTYRPQPLTEADAVRLDRHVAPGERIQYHQGLLLVDRSTPTSPYPSKERQRIHAVAKRAWHACELGLVHLVSQRVEPFVFRYIAVRARMTPNASQVRKQLLTPAH
jgi:hypothetical protein